MCKNDQSLFVNILNKSNKNLVCLMKSLIWLVMVYSTVKHHQLQCKNFVAWPLVLPQKLTWLTFSSTHRSSVHLNVIVVFLEHHAPKDNVASAFITLMKWIKMWLESSGRKGSRCPQCTVAYEARMSKFCWNNQHVLIFMLTRLKLSPAVQCYVWKRKSVLRVNYFY